MRRAIATVALVLALAACDGAPPGSDDAGAAPDAGSPLDTTPEPPRLTPCPPGWSELERDGVTVCDPGARVECTGATFLLPGASACAPVDDGCGSGPFPALPSGATALHVASGATGGDGTLARPFGAISEALAAAAPGTIVALAAGTYEGALDLPDGVELRGVCAERVTIRAGAGAPIVTLRAGRSATLSAMTITGDDVGVLSAGAVTLRGVAVIDVRAGGVAALGAGATIDASRVLVRGTRTDERGRLGRGVEIHLGGARLSSVVVEGSHDGGIAATGGTLSLEDVAVRDTQPNDDGRFGAGISAFEGTEVTLVRAVVEGAREAGLILDGVVATLSDLAVRDVASEPSMANGSGLFLRGANVTLERAWIERASRAGISAYAGSELVASDVFVEGTRLSGPHGVGLGVVESSAQVTRLALRDLHYAGVLAVGEGATASIADLSVERVGISADIGEGLLVAAGASLAAERFAIRSVAVVGAQAFGAGTRLSLRGGSVREVGEGSVFSFGRGVELDVGATGELADVAIDGVRETGVVVEGEGASLAIARVRVSGIGERTCAASTCAGEGGGSGVVSVFGASVVATDLEVEGAPLCGVQVAEGGSLDVESGEIRGGAIGACVQVPGYDVARVVDGVAYRDNETNVDTGGAFVPPPGPTAPPGF